MRTAVAVVTTEADLGICGALDCGLFVTHRVIVLHALGLSTETRAALAGNVCLTDGTGQRPANHQSGWWAS